MTKIVSVKSESFNVADSIVQRREAAKVAKRAKRSRKFRASFVALGTGAFTRAAANAAAGDEPCARYGEQEVSLPLPEATPVRVPWLDGLLRD